MADFELIDRPDADHCVLRIVGGEHHDQVVVVCRDGIAAATVRHLSWFLEGAVPSGQLFEPNTPEEVARTLLESLLSESQVADRWSRGRFWVETPRGSVELGRLFHLSFRDRKGGRLVLCVVPEGEFDLPEADIWTTLLLMLRADPDRFFQVANWRRPPGQRWFRGPVPLFS